LSKSLSHYSTTFIRHGKKPKQRNYIERQSISLPHYHLESSTKKKKTDGKRKAAYLSLVSLPTKAKGLG